MTRKGFASILVILFLVIPVGAQPARTLEVAEGSTLTISGTSNKSDWSVEAGEMSGTFSVSGEGLEIAVQAVRFVVPGRRITSERGVIMNRLMHGAFDVTNHPDIVYELVEVTASEEVDGALQLTARGMLSMAGVANEIEMGVAVTETETGLRFVGSHSLDMTEWNMKPPTAMFGALHTGKEVTIDFDVAAAPGQESGSGR